MDKEFEKWWGDDCVGHMQTDKKELARTAWNAAIQSAAKKHAPKPRELPPIGTGAFYDYQQYCFEKGWKEGIAAFRKRLRGNDV